MMLQIILVVITISAGGERKLNGIGGFEDLESCFSAARHFMEVVTSDFDDLGMREVSAACMVRRPQRPA
jgi:hypothetical protein